MTERRPLSISRLLLFVFACFSLAGAHAFKPAWSAQPFELAAVSSRPDMVSGSDILVRLNAPAGSGWSVWLGGRDVTKSFKPAEGSSVLRALLTGLKDGKNTIEIRIRGQVKSRLEVLNHLLSGPIFSGPHREPFFCQTEANGLGPATDSDCSAPTVVQYYYKSTQPVRVDYKAPQLPDGSLTPGFKPYDLSVPPSDVAQTTTSDGHTVPYIIRREIGVINRGVYDIQFLHQPGQPLPTPWTHPTPGWNGRLVYTILGGSCGAGYHQGILLGSIGSTKEPLLSQGYAIATSTLNNFDNDCRDHISSETLSMVKEHFIKEHGVPVHTIGWGGSGGAMYLYLAAQNYPGLLDGILPFVSFPDQMTNAPWVTDCTLLDHAFQTSSAHWSDEQKAAVSGLASWRACSQPYVSWEIANATRLCDKTIPKDLIYEPTTRPKGIRCDFYDDQTAVLGRNPKTGFAYRTLDNVGVQYGLLAFNRGQIDSEQFVELNERIGGFDADGAVTAARTVADLQGLRNAYERGLLMTGGGGLSEIPIIDWRPYTDDMADNHALFMSFIARARLIAANGSAANQVILTYPRYSSLDIWSLTKQQWTNFESVYPERAQYLVREMDQWLNNIAADGTEGSLTAKVARNKPSDLADSCWAANGEHIVERATYDGPGRCNQLYPAHADPRIAAGGPLADDVLKCQLKPLNPADYVHPLTAIQLQRLEAVFPAGVCDYTKPGVGQEVTKVTWQRF